MNHREIDILTTAVLGGDGRAIDDIFLCRGAECPRAIWDPDPAILPQPQLRFLLAHWEALRGGDAMPRRRALDPVALKPALGFIMLLQAVDDGWDYVYRLYGSEIAPHAMRDYTGKRTSELVMSGHDYITHFYVACYRAVRQRLRPLYTENTPPPAVSITRWHRLVLPLADDRGEPGFFLVGNMPGSRRAARQVA